MIDAGRKLVRGPVFEDGDKTRVAGLLNVILLFSLVMTFADILAVIVFNAHDLQNLWIDLIALVVLLGLLYIARRGYVTFTSLITCISLWLGITIATFNQGGVLNPYFSGYVIVVLVGGLLMGGRAAASIAILSALVGLVYVLRNPSPTTISPNLLGAWIVYSLMFITGAFLLYLADRSIKLAFDRARRNETALKENNQSLEREIAERKQIEAALRNSEEQYRQLLELSPAAISLVNTNAEILYANSAGLALLGADSLDNLKALSLWDIVTPQSIDPLKARFHELENKKNDTPVEYTIRRLDGQTVDVEVGSTLILYQGEKAILSVIVDITERKRAQQELITAEMMRVEVEKERKLMKLKENFVSLVSHEFRTPLSIILSAKEMLERYQDRITEERRLEYLDKIAVQVRYMVGMLDDILILSKANAGILEFYPAPINLEELCYDLSRELEALHIENRKLIFKSQSCGSIYLLDEKLLRRALFNLLSNAVAYSPDNSDIQFDLACDEETATIRIADTGMGIPTSEQEFIFELFYRASNVQKIKGTGLGLAIVRACIECHNGTITFESTEGVGTTFTLHLPLVHESR
jgi:PAS domain S-box-containing protein